MFFLNGKEASCDYTPNARTVKNISSKPITYSNEASEFINKNSLASTTIINLIKYGNVDFSKSKTKLKSCKIYHIDNIYKDLDIELNVENCDSIAKILSMRYINE
jgi:hypothetical protein